MTADSIDSDVLAIVCDQLDVKREDIRLDKNFTDDLGADSLAIVELVLALEEKFEIKIPDEEVENIKKVGDAVNYIRARTRLQPGNAKLQRQVAPAVLNRHAQLPRDRTERCDQESQRESEQQLHRS